MPLPIYDTVPTCYIHDIATVRAASSTPRLRSRSNGLRRAALRTILAVVGERSSLGLLTPRQLEIGFG